MRVVAALVTLTVVFLATSAASSDDTFKIVYGNDNREDFYRSSIRDQWVIRNQTVSFIKSYNLGVPNSKGVYHSPAKASTLLTAQGVCKTERFAYQPTAAFCSGTLIGVDRVMTAAHCVEYCDSSFYMVFDFYQNSQNNLGQIYGKDDVYTCRRLHRRLESVGSYMYDFAIIQLDRPVRGRTPARIVTSKGSISADRVTTGSTLSMYGCPSGLPVKSDHGGVIVYDNARFSGVLDYFEATTDSFGGNSGSGIYNEDGQVVGILVRGKTDYVLDSSRYCRVVNKQRCDLPKCSELTRAEGISYALTAVRAAPECRSDADCRNSASGPRCDLSCKENTKCCTGWCSYYSYPINYNPQECPEYFNYKLTDVADSDHDEDGDGGDGGGGGGGDDGDYSGSSGLPLYTYIMIGVGVVILIVGASFGYRSFQRTKQLKKSMPESYNRLPGAASSLTSTAGAPLVRPRIMAVNLPADTQPGSRLRVLSPEGKQIEFEVPANVQPGNAIHLQY